MITKCFNTALKTGIVSSKWKDVIISVLYKKGDVHHCNNYRGISLINHIGKVLERVIQNRVCKFAEETLWV